MWGKDIPAQGHTRASGLIGQARISLVFLHTFSPVAAVPWAATGTTKKATRAINAWPSLGCGGPPTNIPLHVPVEDRRFPLVPRCHAKHCSQLKVYLVSSATVCAAITTLPDRIARFFFCAFAGITLALF
jgi:hypothetical protein